MIQWDNDITFNEPQSTGCQHQCNKCGGWIIGCTIYHYNGKILCPSCYNIECNKKELCSWCNEIHSGGPENCKS